MQTSMRHTNIMWNLDSIKNAAIVCPDYGYFGRKEES